MNKKRNILSILVIILIVLCGAILYRMIAYGDIFKFEEKVKAQLGQLDGKSEAEIIAALDEIVDENSLRVSIRTNPIFHSGDTEGILEIENHPNNHYNMRVTITCDYDNDGEDEEIYNSGLMPLNPDASDPTQRGSHIQKDKLDVDLDAGVYEALAIFNAYDLESDNLVGTVNVPIEITILT